jgi:hypothetical protein
MSKRDSRGSLVGTEPATNEATMGKRFPIKLPPWHEKRLIWWAAMKGTTKTMLAQNTLQARIEANSSDIEVMLAERAGELGVTVEALKQQLLEKSGFAPDVDDEGSDRP